MNEQADNVFVYEKGETLIEEGNLGTFTFVILKGEVEVFKRNNKGEDVHVARLREGELIGEMCLFQDEAERTATVVAFTDTVEVVQLTREKFQQELAALSPEFREVMNALIARLKKNYARIMFLS